MSTLTTASTSTEARVNREHLAELRSVCAVTPVDPLVLNVEAKVEAGETLDPTEYGVLWHGITEETLEFIRQHPELLS
jgi:hypothetical protein